MVIFDYFLNKNNIGNSRDHVLLLVKKMTILVRNKSLFCLIHVHGQRALRMKISMKNCQAAGRH